MNAAIFILVMLMPQQMGSGRAIATAEFIGLEACEAAAKKIREDLYERSMRSSCVPKKLEK